MGRGKDIGPRDRKYSRACVVCATVFECVRPEAKTNTNACRLFLKRWRKKYGCDPVVPPGLGNLQPSWGNREGWYEKYLPKGHPKNKKPKVAKRK